MRHKTFLFHPSLAVSKGVKIYKCLQKPGEFVITLAKSYHSGFNMGFNCAEAVNFATNSWVNLGTKAKSCDCQSGSVKVDMSYFKKNLVKNRKIKDKGRKNLKQFVTDKKNDTEIKMKKIKQIEKENIPEVSKKRNINLLKRKRKNSETSKNKNKKL